MAFRPRPTLAHAPHDADEFFAELTTLMAEGRSSEAYQYKIKWLPFLLDRLSAEDRRRLDNVDAELFLRGHTPSAREQSRLAPVDPSLG